MESNVEQVRQIQKVVRVIVRRRVLLLTCFLSAVTVVLGFYLAQDKIYTSSALIVYQQQKVNPAKMSPDERGKLSGVVSTLSPLILSRTNLEGIIESQKLYTSLLQKRPMHDVVLLMRDRIVITPSRKGSTFTVSFSHKNPEVVARVTNTIAGKFVEENLRQRQDRAVETSNYTQEELDMAKKTLDKKELILRDYKLKYYNEMPQQRQDNINRLTALQEYYQSKQESIQDLKKTQVLINEQINGRRQLLERLASVDTTPAVQQQSSIAQPLSSMEELQQLKKMKKILLQRYTVKHPKIKALNKRIAVVAQAAVEDRSGQNVTIEDGSGSKKEVIADKTLFDLNLQLKEISLSIAEINKEMVRTRQEIAKYEKWIAAAPVREAEWATISREYGELKKHYDFLVAQNLQARSVMNLERNQKGSQFKIKDTARPPLKPVKPDFLKYILIAIVLGTGFGGGIALCLEFLDTSFRNPEAVEDAFGIEVIACVPQYQLQGEKRSRKIRCWCEGIFFSLWASGLAVVIIFFWSKGKIIV